MSNGKADGDTVRTLSIAEGVDGLDSRLKNHSYAWAPPLHTNVHIDPAPEGPKTHLKQEERTTMRPKPPRDRPRCPLFITHRNKRRPQAGDYRHLPLGHQGAPPTLAHAPSTPAVLWPYPDTFTAHLSPKRNAPDRPVFLD
ncbi:hypothetical protein AAFF_G00306670 [Aldrovandia affinis]|uniref:Uncharacterized protein n=1 Tax=Aldrovandia affinis TaxID=143900 RepID=A0AAD7R813_9TELE|nr:hypothetical protein AAFF_G00306670 [Aldrovandia affinis]